MNYKVMSEWYFIETDEMGYKCIAMFERLTDAELFVTAHKASYDATELYITTMNDVIINIRYL